MRKGKIYLIPSPIAEETQHRIISQETKDILLRLNTFFVENIRTARRYISSLNLGINISTLEFHVLDKNTETSLILTYINSLLEGRDAGIISEAGCPGIADPGSNLVAKVHRSGIQVIPLSGPSSIFLALMASGFNGQMFTFHGYLPIDKKQRIKRILQLETDFMRTGYTQIFMETPYRNMNLLSDLLNTLNKKSLLCIACDISGDKEYIATKNVDKWKDSLPELNKKPTIFLLGES